MDAYQDRAPHVLGVLAARDLSGARRWHEVAVRRICRIKEAVQPRGWLHCQKDGRDQGAAQLYYSACVARFTWALGHCKRTAIGCVCATEGRPQSDHSFEATSFRFDGMPGEKKSFAIIFASKAEMPVNAIPQINEV